jgi:hypothetical protein
MKKLIRSISLVALLAAATTADAMAQTVARADTNKVYGYHHRGGKDFAALKATLTPDQKAMLKQNREKQKAAHEAFTATLTADQKAIMQDKSLSGKGKMEKFRSSLTADQQKLMAANKESSEANRKAFMATLTDAQKGQLKTAFRNHRGGKEFAALKATLTPDQKAMLKQNHEKQKAAHEAFKATLTADQKAIMKDKSLQGGDKMAKLKGSLTEDQQKLMATNRENRKADHKAFVATLSDAQKAQLKEAFKNGRHDKGVVTNRGDVQKS